LYLRERKWWKAGEDCIMRRLHNLYASPNEIRVIKSRKMEWVENITRIGEMKNA
jgi:hypothetical protein